MGILKEEHPGLGAQITLRVVARLPRAEKPRLVAVAENTSEEPPSTE